MSWVGTAIVGSALIGGISSNSAANTQASAANNATAAQLGMYNQTAANVAPWLTAGQGALSQLVAGTQPGGGLMPSSYTPYGLPQFQASPEYQNMQMQDQNAINASLNASSKTGGMNSNNLKGLIGWTQGNATSQYATGLNDYITQFLQGNQAKANQFNTLNTLSQGGQGAALQQGTISANVGQNVGSNIIGAGNAQAAGTVGVGNAITGGISSAYNQWLQQQYLNGSGANYGGNYISPTDLSYQSNIAAGNITTGAGGI